jgi:hypothetical protein
MEQMVAQEVQVVQTMVLVVQVTLQVHHLVKEIMVEQELLLMVLVEAEVLQQMVVMVVVELVLQLGGVVVMEQLLL